MGEKRMVKSMREALNKTKKMGVEDLSKQERRVISSPFHKSRFWIIRQNRQNGYFLWGYPCHQASSVRLHSSMEGHTDNILHLPVKGG
jgi:hypothetical protein